jgi:hypothetical protein
MDLFKFFFRLGRRTLLTLSCGLGGLVITAAQVVSGFGYAQAVLVLLFIGETWKLKF